MHGGFLVGFVLLGIFLFAALWTWFKTSANRIEEMRLKIAAGKRIRNLTGVGSAFAWRRVWSIPMGGSSTNTSTAICRLGFLMDHIDEFQVAQLSAPDRAQAFSTASAFHHCGCGDPGPRSLRLSQGLTDIICGLCGTLCFAEHSHFFPAAGDGRGAVSAPAVCRRILAKNGCH